MVKPPTDEQRSQFVAGVFDRSAATYDAVGVAWFTPIAELLVAELAPQPGVHALDIGCGRGAALWPLAQAVGPAGAVTGIDLSTAMVEATRKDVSARGLSNVDLQVMNASAPDLHPERCADEHEHHAGKRERELLVQLDFKRGLAAGQGLDLEPAHLQLRQDGRGEGRQVEGLAAQAREGDPERAQRPALPCAIESPVAC